MTMKRQFKVSLIEKPLPTNTEPEAVATTATAPQTSKVKPTTTHTKWPTAKLIPIPLKVYNLSSDKIQEVPSSSMKMSQGREGPFTPNHDNPLMEQQLSTLKPKATATATSAVPLTRDDTPWPNTVLTSTNLFIARSWPIPPNGNETPAHAFPKIEKSDVEKAPPKQATTPHPMFLGNAVPYNTNKLSVPSEEVCRWGPQCPVCTQSTTTLKTEDSDWEEKE